MICDIYAVHQSGEAVLPKYLEGCAEVAQYLGWSPECCEDHCAGHPLCHPCAKRSRDDGYIVRLESIGASA